MVRIDEPANFGSWKQLVERAASAELVRIDEPATVVSLQQLVERSPSAELVRIDEPANFVSWKQLYQRWFRMHSLGIVAGIAKRVGQRPFGLFVFYR